MFHGALGTADDGCSVGGMVRTPAGCNEIMNSFRCVAIQLTRQLIPYPAGIHHRNRQVEKHLDNRPTYVKVDRMQE